MTRLLLLTSFSFIVLMSASSFAQKLDSTLENLQKIPTRYIDQIDGKIEKYSNRITSKTKKTLTKLSRWENKIQGLLQKVNHQAADRLFGNNQITFTSLLQKIKDGEALALQYQAPYNKYRDDLSTTLKYLSQQKELLNTKIIEKAKEANDKMKALSATEDNGEGLQEFIKQRKKQLVEQSIQYIGNSKYLAKINKEAYYYAETLRNYKQLFTDSKRAENATKKILSKIPAFNDFIKQNSMLAGLFDISSQGAQIVPGMQTRNSVQQLIQAQLSSMGGNAREIMSNNLQSAQAQLNDFKTKLNSGSASGELPDFKPNNQKPKTFMQRVETSTSFQSNKGSGYLPVTSDVGLSIGYKLNDKSTIGIGGSYKLGWGQGIKHLKITNEGISLKTFVDWKLKKQIFISGGFEMNHYSSFKNFEILQDYNAWQKAGLLGLTKKFNIQTKWFKGSNVQVLYDFLSREHIPVSQPILFRIGYSIK